MRAAGRSWGLMLTALALVCWALALGERERLAFPGGMTAILPSPMTVAEAKSIQAAEERTQQPTAVVPWCQQEGIWIESGELDRSALVSVLTLGGDSRLVLPVAAVLPQEDLTGCLVDRRTAQALFGDDAPIGGTITLENRVYQVRGVFDAPVQVLVRQGDGEWTGGFDRLSLSLPAGKEAEAYGESFALRHGLSFSVSFSTGIWLGLAGIGTRLLPFMLLWFLLRESMGRRKGFRTYPVLSALVLLGIVAAAVLFWMLMGLGFTVPPSMIPARWSDFEFWGERLGEIRRWLWELLLMKKNVPEALGLFRALRSWGWSLGALALWLQARKLLPLDRLEDLLFLLLAGGVGAFAGELLAGGVEIAALWLLPGCWGGWLLMLRWTKKVLHHGDNDQSDQWLDRCL